MRILYTNFHLGWGGGHTTYIISLLRNEKHEQFVACPPGSRLYRILQERGYSRLVPVTFVQRLTRPAAIISNTLALKRAIEKYDIDIVHTNGSPDNRMALYASMFCKKKFRVVFTKHNTNRVKGCFSLWRLNRFNDAVIFVSESVIGLSGLMPGNPRYHVVEHGIDINYWRKGGGIETGPSLRLASNAGTPLHKGWPHLAEAVAMLPQEDQQRISIVVLGRQEPALEAAQARARELCDISFPGFLEDTRPFLEDADIGFVLSQREASSFASREMSAMSLPVISSDFPNACKNIDPGVTGWITRAQDVKSIHDTLRLILDMPPEQLNLMKTSSRAKAEKDFSVEKMIADTNKVYEAVMRQKEGY